MGALNYINGQHSIQFRSPLQIRVMMHDPTEFPPSRAQGEAMGRARPTGIERHQPGRLRAGWRSSRCVEAKDIFDFQSGFVAFMSAAPHTDFCV
jgi:hypothetical protein